MIENKGENIPLFLQSSWAFQVCLRVNECLTVCPSPLLVLLSNPVSAHLSGGRKRQE